MNVKEMVGRVMTALDEVTGFDLTKNTEAYRYRIYEAMDSIQQELSAFVSPIVREADASVSDGRFAVPREMRRVLRIFDKNGNNAEFSYITPGEIVIADGEYTIIYEKYPDVIRKVSEADTEVDLRELEISREAQEAMVYGVCAYLCINDEPELYNTYMNRYTAYMSNILSHRDLSPSAVITGGIRF